MTEEIKLNEHNKQEFPPMHTAEHILNQTMCRIFGCDRSKNTHIEKKKSKCDYFLAEAPAEETMKRVQDEVNEVIGRGLPVTARLINKADAPIGLDLSKLPGDVSDTLRIVEVGDYDVCACIGAHVDNTNQIGTFRIISYDYAEGRLRIRFKLDDCPYTE